MGVIIRESIKGTIISYAGVALGAFNILWLAPKFLQPEEIGLYNIIVQAATLIGLLAQMGTPGIAVKFFPHFKTEDNRHRGFLGLLLTLASFGFLVFAAIYVLFKDLILSFYTDNAPEIANYFFVILLLALIMIYHSVIESFTRLQLRIAFISIVRELYFRVVFFVLVLLVGLGAINFPEFINLYLLLFALGAVAVFYYVWRLRQLYLRMDLEYLERGLVKDILVFGSFILLGSAGALITSKIDILMLGAMTELEQTGIYTIAFFIGTVIEMPRRSISQISSPLLADSIKHGRNAHVQELYYKSALNLFIVGMLFFIAIWSNIDALFRLIPNSEIYVLGKYVVLFVGLSKVMDMATGLNSEILVNSKYYRFNFVLLAMLAVLTVVTNVIFIPPYGIDGAAFATLFSMIVYNVVKYLFLLYKLNLQCFSPKFIYVFIIGAAVYGLSLLIPYMENALLEITLKSLLILVLFMGLIVGLRVSEDVNDLLYKINNQLRKR